MENDGIETLIQSPLLSNRDAIAGYGGFSVNGDVLIFSQGIKQDI